MNRLILLFCSSLLIFSMNTASQGLFESAIAGSGKSEDSDPLSLSGFIRSAGYTGRTTGDQKPYLQSVYAQAALSMEVAPAGWASARAETRFRHGEEFGEQVAELDLREAYVYLRSTKSGLRIGKLITPWGKATLFNPVGKMTPIDPTIRSPVADDRYLGMWSVDGHLRLGSMQRITVHWRPLFRPSVLLIDPVPLPGYVVFGEPEYPGTEFREGNYGVHYELFSPLLDFSLYWFRGYHHWPGIRFESVELDGESLLPVELRLRQKAYRISMAGADLSLPLESWIFRMEGAWQHTHAYIADKEYLPLSELSYVGELEKTGAWWNLVAGYYGKYIIDFFQAKAEPTLSTGQDIITILLKEGVIPTTDAVNQIIREQVSAFNRLYNAQLREFYHSVFVNLQAGWLNERLEVTIPLIFNMSTKEWMIRPELVYKPGGGITLSAGYQGMYAQEGELYDLVGPVLNAAWFTARLTF